MLAWVHIDRYLSVMANLARVRCVWSGAPVVGPGLTTFYFDEAHEGFASDVSTFFQAVDAYIPIGVTIAVPSDGDLLDVATGELTGTWAEAASGPGVGAGFGAYPSGVGARLVWSTDGIVAGRRVRGSTFLCPLVNSSYGTDGTLDNATKDALEAAGNALRAASGTNMKIWSRPAPGRPGAASSIVAATCPDKVSWLRSRRT